MQQFFRTFLAALLALFFFFILSFFLILGIIGGATAKTSQPIPSNAVLVLDLSKTYMEQPKMELSQALLERDNKEIPSLYSVIQSIRKAKFDDKIKGIFIIANENTNGMASSQEIRNALLEFKSSNKFIIAHGDIMTQSAYSIANIAQKIYVSPEGSFEWKGFGVSYMFFKGLIDKMQIKPQIFYAGKFKSATEPFRVEKMTDENKLQTKSWLDDIYQLFIYQTAVARKLDSSALMAWANQGKVDEPKMAVELKLIDGVKYNDEVRNEISKSLQLKAAEKINFVAIDEYAGNASKVQKSQDKIALLYANGDIIDGKGETDQIGSQTYIELLRKAREDESVKAIVVRVNSGGGSALASDNIHREMSLAKAKKPLIVSFGDVAASGGYYMSCNADSIFAQPNTITGSIGVFGIVPDFSVFMKNKLGITTDEVSTGPLGNAMSVTKPMNEMEKKMIQKSIENIYSRFKKLVSEGRNKDTTYVESIAQGRVWSGVKAKEIGLVDALGGLNEAIQAAAKKAKLNNYELIEFPKKKSLIEQVLGLKLEPDANVAVRKTLGETQYYIYQQLKSVQEMSNIPQTKIPFEFRIH
ncbi:MAG: signal peptide peptidase SppA [Chitinophagaceae bacterium]|nr:MAG: signal peptide peptidase SppA [Chitinophagaceae bacterium]